MNEQPSKKLNMTVKLLFKAGAVLVTTITVVNGSVNFLQLKVAASALSNSVPLGKITSPPTVNSKKLTAKISIYADKSATNTQTNNNNFVDTNSYGSVPNKKPTEASSNSPSVIFTERSKDCQTVINNEAVAKITCTPKPPKTPPKPLMPTAKFQGAPLTVAHLGDGKTALLFPIPTAVPITSGFGWRINPFNGLPQLHEGTDLAAPIGTPVLAAYPGKVEVARAVDGYGLAVYLRHEKNTQESRYAHLSSILVREGEWVRQGEVIGLVGNTGLSSGPHLHFEWRYWINNNWVAVDAKLNLEYARNALSPNTAPAYQPATMTPSLTPGDYRRAPRSDNKPLTKKTVMIAPVSLPLAVKNIFNWSEPFIQVGEELKTVAALPFSWTHLSCSDNPDSTLSGGHCSVLRQ